MTSKISKKTIYILVGIFIFVIFTTLSGIRIYFRWTNTQYFGEIVEVQKDSFVIKTEGDSEILILTNQKTDIRRGGRIWMEQLQAGNFVIVVGSTNQEGFIEARVIRIMAPPRPFL